MDYTLNPYNSRTRADGQGVRPDLLSALTGTIATKDDVATVMGQAREAIDASRAANAELEALLDPENENSELWLLQWQINENDRLALERHQEAIEANASDIATIRPHVTRALWLNLDVQSAENEYIRLYRGASPVSGNPEVRWDIKPGWVGSFQIVAGTRIATGAFNDRVYMREVFVPNSQVEYFSDESVGSVLCTINIRPGTAKDETLHIPDQNINRDWQTLQSWTIPQTTEVAAAARLTFTNKTRIATYGLRIMVDGQNVTTSSTAATSPLFGHGPRVHSASMDVRRLKAGSVISLQAKADHSNSLNRHISNATFDVTWIDNTEPAD